MDWKCLKESYFVTVNVTDCFNAYHVHSGEYPISQYGIFSILKSNNTLADCVGSHENHS